MLLLTVLHFVKYHSKIKQSLYTGKNTPQTKSKSLIFYRSLEGSGSDFASDFHLFGLEWTKNSLTFTLDNEITGSITPPSGGFWKIGGFDQNPGGPNLWENGEYLAPFDRDVRIIMT
jgi:beta-glucanase (GH16 family)